MIDMIMWATLMDRCSQKSHRPLLKDPNKQMKYNKCHNKSTFNSISNYIFTHKGEMMVNMILMAFSGMEMVATKVKPYN